MRYVRWGVVVYLLLAGVSLSAAQTAAASVSLPDSTVMVCSKGSATIFLVRNGDGAGAAEHLFQVWSKPGFDLNAVYRGATVEYSGTALVIVVPPDKSITTYNVSGYRPPAMPAPAGFAAKTVEVAGLNHQLGRSVERLTISLGPPSARFRAVE